MRWKKGRRSMNIEDRRGQRPRMGRGLKLGGGMGLLVLAAVALLSGDPRALLQALLSGGLGGSQMSGSGSAPADPKTAQPSAKNDQQADFVSVVLADTEDVWRELFRQKGLSYQAPKLVLFRDAVQSACGFNKAAVGPFYCPADLKAYLDLSFFDDLHRRHKAPGDFAQAYVIAHEIGHHVQNLLGTSQKVHQSRRRVGRAQANALSVRLELQADCYAGVWAHHADKARRLLESGDVEEGLGAAAAIGDDRLQMQGRGYVSPESFTHGSSKQRVRWFKTGLAGGRLADCDTFAANH